MANEASEQTTTMNLMNDVTISNANNTWKFRKGSGVKVPKSLADEVARIDYRHQEYRNNLVKDNNYIAPAGYDPQLPTG